MRPDISIIVPIYQVEQYIKNCMISICSQTFKNFEVVLVNDGSKDKSVYIAEKILTQKGVNYKVLHQHNKGVSSARNEGIKKSTGQWVVCVDSDDVINNKFLELLYKGTFNKNVVVSIVNFKSVTMGNLFTESKINTRTEVINRHKILNDFLYRNKKIIVPAMLLKRQFIDEENLFFNEDIKFSEDQEFIWRVLFKINFCSYNESMLYNYLSRDNSIMSASSIDKIMTGFNGFKIMTEQLISHYDKKFIDKIMCRWVFGSLHASSKITKYDDFKILAKKMNYQKYLVKLIQFDDFRVKILSCILGISLKSFYKLCRFI